MAGSSYSITPIHIKLQNVYRPNAGKGSALASTLKNKSESSMKILQIDVSNMWPEIE
jgi:hypothetical protein